MAQNLKQNIGSRVKLARKQKGMTQAELAAAIDKAFETVSNIERGKTAPNFLTLWDISLVVGVPMRDFFDMEQEGTDGTLVSAKRQELLLKMHHTVEQLDDNALALWVKLGQTLAEHSDEDGSSR
ncbi:MAG: helix-turn-helix transcriptional regulator [Rhizobiaceae bacterium]